MLLRRLLRRQPCTQLRLHCILLLLLLLLLLVFVLLVLLVLLLVVLHLDLLLVVLLLPLVVVPLLLLRRKYGRMQPFRGNRWQGRHRDVFRIHCMPRWNGSPFADATGRRQTWLIVHQQRCQAGRHRGLLAATADAQHLRKRLPGTKNGAVLLWRRRQVRLLLAGLACGRMHGEGLWVLRGGARIAMLRLRMMRAVQHLRGALLLCGLRMAVRPALVQLRLERLTVAVDGRQILPSLRLLCKLYDAFNV